MQLLREAQIRTLANACRVASEFYDKLAVDAFKARDEYEALTPKEKAKVDATAMLAHPGAGGILGEQFQRQAAETRTMLDWIEGNDLDDEKEEYVANIGREIDA